ncbi:hypothetical protein Ndes2526B_g06693 [Nannochloris sp. 'desiccata']|nr:hypothetical protein KSW81_005190 [Chlorella desiccata (nom. nud.)]KAH7617807.1 hypothetical protein NADE_000012 [Chlorella desiccata (nom. nud.)]
MVFTGTFSLTNWITSRPLTSRPVSVRRNVRAYPTVIASVASADDSFPENSGGSCDDDENNYNCGPEEIYSSSSWRGPLSSWSFPARNWPLLLKTLAVHGAHITARLISQPFRPALEKIQQRAASSAAVKSACAAFQVEDLASLHDVANALVLAESVYKVVGRPEHEAVRIMSSLKSNFPPGIVTISSVQFAREHVAHRFAISQSEDALYVAFMGTKLPRDFLANASAWQEEVQLDADTVVKSNDAEKMNLSDNSGLTNTSTSSQEQAPAAHRGFLMRARGIPIEALFAEAQKRGKRLVLCGHSLGGAVATLTAISILQRLPPEQHSAVSCVGFATPALGNAALATMVKERQWHDRIINYLVPEDPIPRLLSVNSSYSNSGIASRRSTDEEASRETGSGSSGDSSSAIIESLPSQFDVVGNIAAVPGRLMSFSRRAASKQQEQEPVLAETASPSALPSAEVQVEEDQSTGTTSSPGFRRSISRGTLKMVNLATAPLRRPIYQPLGRQLFICEGAVTTERPLGTSGNSRTGGGSSSSSSSTTSSNSNTTNTTASAPVQQSSSSGNGTAATKKKEPSTCDRPSTTLQWWTKLPISSSFVLFSTNEAEGDDDNVDVAAATAAADGIIPDRLPRRTLFPMHRMLTYRTRLLSICQDAFSGHRWPVHSLLPASFSLSYSLPHVPNFPHPDDVVLSELLAPAMFPLKAEASVPLGAMGSQQSKQQGLLVHELDQQTGVVLPQKSTSSSIPTSTLISSSPRVSFVMATRQKLTWPLRILLRRPRKGDTKADSAPVDVVVRIEGRGLCNVTAAWVSGGCVDVNSGKSTPIEAELISMPRAPVPSQVVSKSQKSTTGKGQSSFSLMEPVSALASWVAMAVGWVSLLRQLQKPSRSDYLLARVKLPASTVRAAHRARSDPFAVAVGEGPKLMVHLQSDFAVHSLPLIVEVVGEEGSGGGGGGGDKNEENMRKATEVQKRYKDANQFLRNAKSGLSHL